MDKVLVAIRVKGHCIIQGSDKKVTDWEILGIYGIENRGKAIQRCNRIGDILVSLPFNTDFPDEVQYFGKDEIVFQNTQYA
ncbi:MAG: hypothetical protein PVI88_00070 [Nitrosopumilaceae archaeon]|jgi:hypothetical protein